MGIKRPKGYGLVSRVPGGDLNDYMSAFTIGNEDLVFFGQNRTQESILTRRIRTTEDNGQDLGVEGGRGLGTNKSGGDLNLYLGKSTGNATPGSLVIYTGGSGSSGDTLNSGKTEVFRVNHAGNITAIGSIEIDGNVEVGNEINLGHASDTTLARVSAGVVSIEGSQILTGQINLTSQVTGILPAANGGTGLSSLTALGNALYSYQYLTWEVNTNSFTGTNYEFPALNGGFGSDSYTVNSGLARNTAIDGSVTTTLAKNAQQMGWYVPHACELVGISGLFRNNGSLSSPRDVAVFVGTPDIGSTATPTYTQRAFAGGNADGGDPANSTFTTNVTLGTPFSLSAGNVVMPAVCNSTGSSTVSMQGNFSIIIRTALTT